MYWDTTTADAMREKKNSITLNSIEEDEPRRQIMVDGL
jgi:hypothetical protein